MWRFLSRLMRKSALTFHEPPEWPMYVLCRGEKIQIIGRWHFLVESKSEDGHHVIDLEHIYEPMNGGSKLYAAEKPGCTCTSWRTRSTCRHMDAVLAFCGLDPADIGS